MIEAVRNPPPFRRRVRHRLAAAIASAVIGAPLALAPVTPAFAQARPTNLADLVELGRRRGGQHLGDADDRRQGRRGHARTA